MSYNLIVQTAGSVRALRGHHRATLRKLAEYAHKDGTGIFPSHIVLADEIGCCVKTVERHIKTLIELGYVQIRKRRFNNLREYAIPLEKIGLTTQMVEDSLKPRKKKPRENPIEQEEAEVTNANEQAYARLKERQGPQDLASKILRAREEVITYQERYDNARAVGNKFKADAIELNLWSARDRLDRLLKQKQREETHQNEYTETHARR